MTHKKVYKKKWLLAAARNALEINKQWGLEGLWGYTPQNIVGAPSVQAAILMLYIEHKSALYEDRIKIQTPEDFKEFYKIHSKSTEFLPTLERILTQRLRCVEYKGHKNSGFKEWRAVLSLAFIAFDMADRDEHTMDSVHTVVGQLSSGNTPSKAADYLWRRGDLTDRAILEAIRVHWTHSNGDVDLDDELHADMLNDLNTLVREN